MLNPCFTCLILPPFVTPLKYIGNINVLELAGFGTPPKEIFEEEHVNICCNAGYPSQVPRELIYHITKHDLFGRIALQLCMQMRGNLARSPPPQCDAPSRHWSPPREREGLDALLKGRVHVVAGLFAWQALEWQAVWWGRGCYVLGYHPPYGRIVQEREEK